MKSKFTLSVECRNVLKIWSRTYLTSGVAALGDCCRTEGKLEKDDNSVEKQNGALNLIARELL